MNEAILILNAGSSSLKFSVYQSDAAASRLTLLCDGAFSGIGHRGHFTASDAAGVSLVDRHLVDGTTHGEALKALLDWLEVQFVEQRLIGAAHRVAHGGARYSAPVIIDDTVIAEMTRLIPLAPLHQPHHLAAIAAVARLHPALPQVACFDTAFHHGEAKHATDFALPRSLIDEGIRRYGFHGLSYEYIASTLPGLLGERADGRVVVAHLGSGASLCAMARRQSVATTMGFSTLDGLPMSRRCGALDPGVVLYLIQQKGMTAAEVSDLLYHDSGLYGVSGLSDGMKDLLTGDLPAAKDAVDLFVYRIGRELGSLAAALGGLDALVFTAGIGEHAHEIRRRVCLDAGWLGVVLDPSANLSEATCISRPEGRASAWVIPTNEDLMIARRASPIAPAP